MKIEDIELLKKIIYIQICIIQGRPLRGILHMDQSFFLNFVNAKIITICILESEEMYMEHIFEKDKLFEHLIKEYILSKKDFKCDRISSNYNKCLPKNRQFYITDSFYDIYKGPLSKKEALTFKKEISMEEVIIMPIPDIENKKRIAYITYIFDKKEIADIQKLEELKSFFEILIQSMYDTDKNILYSKCIRVDRHFHVLSSTERIIIKKVIKGESYIEISEELKVSINTIKTHMKNIFNKYNVHSKVELFNKIASHII